MPDPVLLERDGTIARLTRHRPDVGNAIDVATARALLEAAGACDRDDGIPCVVIGGAGRMFCAGGDVRQLCAAGDALPDLLKEITAYMHAPIVRLARLGKPVVTAIQGPAAGASIGLAAIEDVALAAPAAHFTFAYPGIGLSPDAGATWLLPRLIGLRRAGTVSDQPTGGCSGGRVDRTCYPCRRGGHARRRGGHARASIRALSGRGAGEDQATVARWRRRFAKESARSREPRHRGARSDG